MHSLHGRPVARGAAAAARRQQLGSILLAGALRPATLSARQLRRRPVTVPVGCSAPNGNATSNEQPSQAVNAPLQQAPLPLVTTQATVGAPGASAEQLLQQVAGQQMLLLQQQVTLLTQLLQQSQQQNATLASQVQQMTRELSGIKQQMQLGPAAASLTAQQQAANMTPYTAYMKQLMPAQQDEQQQVAHEVQQPVHVQDAIAASAEAAAVGVREVSQQDQEGSADADEVSPSAVLSAAVEQEAEEEQQPAACVAQATAQVPAEPAAGAPDSASAVAEPHSSDGSRPSSDAASVPPAHAAGTSAAASPATPASGSETVSDAANAERGGQQQLRPRDDAFVQAVYRCRSWQRLRTVVEDNQRQQQLQPWQLLAALRQLNSFIDSGASTAGSSLGNNSQPQRQQQQQRQQYALPEDLGCSLLQCLLQHAVLWVPAAPGLACALYPHETKALLLAAAGLSLKLPFASNDQLQALYEDAVHHGIPHARLQQQQQDEQQQEAVGEASWVLSADQQVQLLGGCLTLGLKPLQQHLELLGSLQPASVASFSLLGSALLVFVADALLANRMLGNPAAAAPATGSLSPSQVAIGEVPPRLLAAALQRLGSAGAWQLNRQMGCRRIEQLLLLPMVRLSSHRHLQLTVAMQQQHQNRQHHHQQQQSVDEESQDCNGSYSTSSSSASDSDSGMSTSGMPGLVQDVCNAVQRAISDGLYAQHQKQQQQSVRGGRSSSSSSSTARRPPNSKVTGRLAPSGGWTVVTSAVALLLMDGQLGCLISPRCLPVFTAAAGAQLSSLPDHLLLPLVQSVTTSASVAAAAAAHEASSKTQEDGQQEAADSQASKQQRQQQRRGYGRWRSAVLSHLGSVNSRLRLDQLLGAVLALAQHHTQEAQHDSSSSSNTESSNTFLEDCSKAVDAAVEHQMLAVNSALSHQRQQRQPKLLPYSSQQLAVLLPQLQQAGLQPSSSTATGLLQLILLAPKLNQQAAGHRGGPQMLGLPALAQPGDLAAAYTAASQLRNAPEQQVMQQLAQALQQAGQHATAGGSAATWSSAASSRASGAAMVMSAAEACALICSLAPALEDGDAAAPAAEPSSGSSNRAKLGNYAFAAFQGISQLQGSQLAAFVAALAALRVSLGEALGARSLDGKAKVTYGMVLAAAASAAASPTTLAATPPDAVAQLAAGVVALGGRPDAAWWAAVQQRLAGQMSAVGAQRLQGLLGALLACGVRPGQEWLQEACQATLTAYNSVSAGDAASLQELRQQSCREAVRLISCSSLLVQLGAAQLAQGLQEALLVAVDTQLLQPFAEGAVSTASPLQPGAAAGLLADAGCALAAVKCDVPEGWLARYAAVAGVLLPVASGDSCCRLSAAVCGLGCQLSPAWLRELQRQLDAKVASASSSSICSALASLRLLSARPSPFMANTLVIKTQQQLAAAPETCTAAPAILPGGLLAPDLAGAVWAVASAELRLPHSWCTAATAHLAAAAAALPPLAVLQVMFAAASWHIKLPSQLLQAVQDLDLDQQQLQPAQLLPQQQLSTVASSLLAAGQAVPQLLVPHLPETVAAAAAAAESQAAGQSPSGLAEALWQQARSLLSLREQCNSMDAGVVAAAVAGLQGLQPSQLVSCMRLPERWSIVLQAFAQQQQQQQQGADACSADALLQLADASMFVASVAAAVQQVPGTALVAAGAPSTLLALGVLGAEVQQAWLAALVAEMDASAGSKVSWFKQASAAETLAYLQALAAAGQAVSAQQIAALAKHLPGKMQALSAAQLVLLLQLLPAAELPPAAGTPAASKHQPRLKQQQQAVETLISAALVLLLGAAQAGQLQQAQAQQAIAALVRLGSRVLMQPVDESASSRSSSSKAPSNSKKAQAQQSQEARLTAEGVQQLLCVALGSPEQQQAGANSAVALGVPCLLGCMQLAMTLPHGDRSPQLLQQLLLLFVHEVSQQDEQLHPHIAAQLFCPAVAMTVSLNPAIALGTERPEAQLGGCLVQCLADVEAGWQHVGPPELAALPGMAARVQLELTQPQLFVDVVLLRLQGLVQLAKASQVAAAEAAAAGAGPAHLLHAAVLQVMNKEPAEAGDSTWQGLANYVVGPNSSAAGAGQQHVVIPLAAFDAADEVAAMIGSSMSAGELCDMLHCFYMAEQTQRHLAWVAPAMQKLSVASEAAALSHNQQQALLVMMSGLASQPEQQTPDMLQAVLSASMSSLERWPTAMLPFTLQTLGTLLLRWAGQMPEQVEPLLLQWQQAAVAALQPRLHLLPASSYVQLLLGCSRLKLGMQLQAEQEVKLDGDQAGGSDQQQQQLGQQAVDACLRAALLQVSGLLDELSPDDCVRLMAAFGSVAGVGPGLGQELMARLQPQLSSLSISQLVDAFNAFAKCPDQARPEMPPAWLEAFLAATGGHLQQAMPISAPNTAVLGAGAAVLPHHLVQLASAVPYLPAPPPRAWHSQFVLAAAGMTRDFTGQQAAQLLHALALWKQTLAAHIASGGSSAESAAAAHASFASCLPLYDSLMLAASRAGGIAPPSVGTANGGLSLQMVQVLPASLRELQWPADEEAVQTVQGYIAGFRQMTLESVAKVEPVLQMRRKQLQQLQDAVTGGSSSVSRGGSKKERKGSSRSKQRPQQGVSTKQQQAQLQEAVVGLQRALDQAAVMLQGLDATADDWQQLLQPGTDGEAAAAATRLPTGVCAGFSRGGEDRMMQGLDVDSLMAGMMQAAGMPTPAAAASTMADSSGVLDAATASELDNLLGGLALMSEVQGGGWGLLLDQDDVEGEGEEEEGGQQYVDTVAEDVV